MLEGTTADLILHLITLLTAVALLTISYRAYTQKRNSKFAYVLIAFGLFAIKEFTLTLTILTIIPPLGTWITHVLNLAILISFFRGTV